MPLLTCPCHCTDIGCQIYVLVICQRHSLMAYNPMHLQANCQVGHAVRRSPHPVVFS